jgi:NAD(P)-dependent dehydrogenase (short-subunit alcohol dehydrogenase family)
LRIDKAVDTKPGHPLERTIMQEKVMLLTGAASGIGQATAQRLSAKGIRVIGVDLRDAEITVDLGTADGRARMIEEAQRLAPEGLDGVLAGAGISAFDRPRETIAINYFGAVGTLEGLRPLLAMRPRARAVAVCSTSALLPTHEATIVECLAGREEQACAAIEASPQGAYMTSKRALGLWLRRAAVSEEWGGSSILLNAIAPGVVTTPMTAPLFNMPEMIEVLRQSNPMAVQDYAQPEEMAEMIDYLLNFEGHYMLGQIIYNDGGTDAIMRPDLI